MKRLLLITLLTSSLAPAMEQAPQPNVKKSHFEQLPGDMQRYLLPFLLSTVSIRADLDTLFSLACANKYLNAFINHEDTLKYIITICANNHSWYDEVSIAHYIQNMHGMKTPGMQEWVLKRKNQIVLEKDLLIATGNDDPKSMVRVNELLSQGINLNTYSRITKRTPLVQATLLANTEMIVLLLQAGANPNFSNLYFTPLIVAIGKRRKDLVELLLAAGARTDLKFREFGTALDYTRTKGYIEIEQLLLAHENRKNMEKKQ